MKIVIAGAGQLGFSLAKLMRKKHHTVHIIEKDIAKCRHISNELGTHTEHGDCTDINVLTRVGRGCDVFIAVTGRDEDNIVCAQLAKLMIRAGKTIARANNPANEEIMKKLGIDYVICTSEEIARLIDQEASVEHMHLIAPLSNSNAGIYTFVMRENSKFVGKKIQDIDDLPKECLIIAIVRKGKFIIPRGDTVLLKDDSLNIVCSINKVKQVDRLFG